MPMEGFPESLIHLAALRPGLEITVGHRACGSSVVPSSDHLTREEKNVQARSWHSWHGRGVIRAPDKVHMCT